MIRVSKGASAFSQRLSPAELDESPASPATGDSHSSNAIEKIEFLLHLCVWTFGCLYSIYQACRFTYVHADDLSPGDFEDSWSLLGARLRDVSDYEWAAFSHIIYSGILWYVAHLVLSVVVRKWMPSVLPYVCVCLSLSSYVHLIGFEPALFLSVQILTMYALQLFKSRLLCWLVNAAFLVLLMGVNNVKFVNLLVDGDTYEGYMFIVTISWTICRTLSFCTIGCQREDAWLAEPLNKERCGPSRRWHQGLSLYLAYCLYLPLLYMGPLVMYDTFEKDFCRAPSAAPLSLRRLLSLLSGVVHYVLWLLFLEVTFHYVYLSALVYSPHLASQLSAWALCGLCFGMSQLFMVKYAVFYGLHGAIAQLDGFQAPHPPKCIARIHLYSDMWKHFDNGLYNFLKCNIYIPIMGGRRGIVSRLVGGAASFTFVFVWHGATRSIFVWSFLNYVGVVLENGCTAVTSTKTVANFLRANVNPTVRRHLKALISAPLLMMSAISNFYFICGGVIGDIVVQRIVVDGWPFPALAVLMFLYCMCYMSEEIKLWEERRQREIDKMEHCQ